MAYKEDLRIVRTRKLLSNTLLEMMEEESIEKISVVNLCNRAMVNRATFYAHFEDKYHLLSYALEELKDDVYAKFTANNKFQSPYETIHALTMMAVDFFYDNHSSIVNVITNNRSGHIVETIQNSIAKSIKYQLQKYKDNYDINVPLNIVAHYIAGGIMSVALYSIDNPTKYTKQDLQLYAQYQIPTNFMTKKN